MFLTGIGTAVPPNRYTQAECWEALANSDEFAQLTSRSRAILRKVLLGRNGIKTRHLALEPLAEVFDISPDVLHTRFLHHAPMLATSAAQQALEQAHTSCTDIDALLISTCTGYLCPGLTSYVAERLGCRPDVLALDLVGQGCGAALPNLRSAAALIASGRCRKLLSVCVEVCSAAFYLDDDPGVLISACLFGDGAAATVCSADPEPNQRTVKWLCAGSTLAPASRDLLRFEQRNGLLRNILSPTVPVVAAEHAATVLDRVLIDAGRAKSEVNTWILHAGGRDVLSAVGQKLQLHPSSFCWSERVLEQFGNLSSPFVLFVLKLALENQAPPGLWWMASFGAGFSSHGALLEVE